jgi:hypothetical protein
MDEYGLPRTSSSEDLRDGLRKERRLLIVTSLVFLAHLWFGLTVDKGAETLGLKFEVTDPNDIWRLVAILWAWALLRYGLFFHDYTDDDMGTEHKRRTIRFHERLTALRLRLAAMLHGAKGVERRWRVTVGVKFLAPPTRTVADTLCYPDARVTYMWPPNRSDAGTRNVTIEPGWERFALIYAWLQLTFVTRYGTEYFVPFILGLAPALTVVCRHFVHGMPWMLAL